MGGTAKNLVPLCFEQTQLARSAAVDVRQGRRRCRRRVRVVCLCFRPETSGAVGFDTLRFRRRGFGRSGFLLARLAYLFRSFLLACLVARLALR